METYEREYCVRDYHVHKDSHTWEAAMGEKIECVREQSNAVDRYAVAVLKDGTIVGHLPKTSERMYSFLRRDGVIQCRVAGRRKYSDLLQGIKLTPDKIINSVNIFWNKLVVIQVTVSAKNDHL